MLDYLRRLATTGFAYTGASVISKLIALVTLPIYTGLLSTTEYGQAEVMFGGVVAVSIFVRFGLLEALLRFYYLPEEDGDDVVRSGFAGMFWATTAFALIALPFAPIISEAVHSEPGLVRIAIGGLWLLTLYEYLLTLLRIDEHGIREDWITDHRTVSPGRKDDLNPSEFEKIRIFIKHLYLVNQIRTLWKI